MGPIQQRRSLILKPLQLLNQWRLKPLQKRLLLLLRHPTKPARLRRPRRKKVVVKLVESEGGTLWAFSFWAIFILKQNIRKHSVCGPNRPDLVRSNHFSVLVIQTEPQVHLFLCTGFENKCDVCK